MRKSKIYNIISFIFLCFFLLACYTRFSTNQFKNNFNISDSTITIAVLDFEYSGSFVSSKNARLVADLVTSELYIEKNTRVVDRSLIRNILVKFENSRRGKFSKDDINNIGKELKATHLVLGSLNSIGSIEDFYETGKKRLNITLRLLDSSTGEVVGILRNQKQGEDDMDELIKQTVREMIQFL